MSSRIPPHQDDFRKAARCPLCKLSRGLCVCDILPRFELPYRFVVLRHGQESNKQSNTGSLVPEIVAGSQLVEWGFVGNPTDTRPVLGTVSLADPTAQYFNLYPLSTATPLSPTAVVPEPGRIPTFIVLDATWRKARRMLHRLPEIHRYPFFRLPPGPQPSRVLRRAPRPDHFSTLGAVIGAMEAMGDTEAAARTAEFMETLFERILQTRGRADAAWA